MNSCEFATLITSISCTIVKCSTPEETALLAAVFTQVGDTLATILAHGDACKPVSAQNKVKPASDSSSENE